MLPTDVADVSAAEEGGTTLDRETLDVGGLLRSAVAASRTAYERAGVELVRNGPSRSCAIRADAHRLGQVLTNLLDNALHHSESGQPVTLAARINGPVVEVSVIHRGTGIPAAQLTPVVARFSPRDPAPHHHT